MNNRYTKQVLLPLGATLALSFIVVFALMAVNGRDLASAFGTSIGATVGGMMPSAILWLMATSIGYRKFKDSPFKRAVLHIVSAVLAAILWTVAVYIIALPTLNQGGGFADLAIIIIGLFSGIFALVNIIVSIIFYKLRTRLN